MDALMPRGWFWRTAPLPYFQCSAGMAAAGVGGHDRQGWVFVLSFGALEWDDGYPGASEIGPGSKWDS